MVVCPQCGTAEYNDHQFCQQCLTNLYGKEADEKRRRPMTDWERTKLGFYRSEKRWIENIKSRMQAKDRTGKPIIVSNQGVVPHAPKSIWAKPKGAR